MAREAAVIETWMHPKYKERVPIRLEKKSGQFYAIYGEHRIESLQLPDVRERLSKLVDELMQLEWQPMLEISCTGFSKHTVERSLGIGMSETVSEEEPDKQETGEGHLDINFRRSWIAQKSNGQWLICHEWFSVDENDPENLAKTEDEAVFFTYRPMKRRLNARDFYFANQQEGGKGFSLPFTNKDGHPSWHRNGEVHYVAYTPDLWTGLNDLVYRIDQIRERLEVMLGKEEGRLRLAGLANRLLPPGALGSEDGAKED